MRFYKFITLIVVSIFSLTKTYGQTKEYKNLTLIQIKNN